VSQTPTPCQETWPDHGGQGAALLDRLGLSSVTPTMDVSASLNPLGPPAWLSDWLASAMSEVRHYPDPEHRDALAALAASLGIAPPSLVLTNGGAEAIHLVARAYRRARALIVEPTFGEYARACRLNDIEIERVQLSGDDFRLDVEALSARLAFVDLVFVCRPNNPTGTRLPRCDVEALVAAARRSDTLVVIDEAFVDFADDEAPLTDLVEQGEPLVLLRSLTKFYALAGLRLGYLVASPQRCRALQHHQVAWSVNGLAAAVVPELLADSDFARRTRDWLHSERAYLTAGLRDLGLTVADSQANFVLFRPPGLASQANGEALLAYLARHGCLARHTHTFNGLDGVWIRVALQRRADNDRLLSWLGEWLGDGLSEWIDDGLGDGLESLPEQGDALSRGEHR
tara:strand:+ start:1332 stop:2531 length:1200 start_codon:yes stop_codon:yes gene_type:complete